MKRRLGPVPLTSVVNTAPGHLKLVQDLLNTSDRRRKTEELTNPQTLEHWLSRQNLLIRGAEVTETGLRQVIDVREGVRSLAAANNGAELDEDAIERLNRVALRARYRARFAPGGAGRFEPAAAGLDDFLALLIEIVITAQLDGRWRHFKACAHSACRGAFWDVTKNHSGKWCSMQRCGILINARTYRSGPKYRPLRRSF